MTLFMFSILIIVQYTLLFILLTQVVCVYLQLHITHYSIIRSSNLDILSSPRPQSFSTWNSMMPKYIYEYIYQYIRYLHIWCHFGLCNDAHHRSLRSVNGASLAEQENGAQERQGRVAVTPTCGASTHPCGETLLADASIQVYSRQLKCRPHRK